MANVDKLLRSDWNTWTTYDCTGSLCMAFIYNNTILIMKTCGVWNIDTWTYKFAGTEWLVITLGEAGRCFILIVNVYTRLCAFWVSGVSTAFISLLFPLVVFLSPLISLSLSLSLPPSPPSLSPLFVLNLSLFLPLSFPTFPLSLSVLIRDNSILYQQPYTLYTLSDQFPRNGPG